MKNRNITVGHAGVIIVDGPLAEFHDFGRYVTPLGFGRARSESTDPALGLKTVVQWNEDGHIHNLKEVLDELETKQDITHASDGLYASVVDRGVSAANAREYAMSVRDKGYVKYNGMKPKDNNCARFAAQTALAGLGKDHPMYNRFKWPWTTAPSPYSNVIASNRDGYHCQLHDGVLTWHHAKPWHALTNAVVNAYASFSMTRAPKLPRDHEVEQVAPKVRPQGVRSDATYLGGIGEGVYYQGVVDGDSIHVEKRHRITGEIIHGGRYAVPRDVNLDHMSSALEFTYPSHYAWVSLKGPKGQLIRCDRV